MQKKTPVLVTGGAGFIGSNVVRALEERGHKAVILDDFSHADFKNIQNLKADVICASVCDENVFNKLPSFSAVIHEAAITDTTLRDDNKILSVNFNGFKNVLEFCLRKKIKLIYASSAGVYGNGPYPAKEDQALNPLNTYAYSKYLDDLLVRKVIKTKLPLIVGLRYFNVYGPYEYHKGKSASMIYQLYLQMKDNRSPRIFKFGDQQRDFIYVRDVARITVECLKLKKSSIINVGTGTPRSFNDIISVLNKNLGKGLKPDYFDNPYSGLYQNFTQAYTASLKSLKLEAQYSLEKGISNYVKNYLE